jgi:neuronal growth regulator 1
MTQLPRTPTHHIRMLPLRLRLSDIHFHLYIRTLLSIKMKNLRAGCVLFAATLSLCLSQRAPIITYIAEDQEVIVGGTVEIGCSVQYAGPEYPVIWAKRNDDGLVYISTGTSLVLKESRFTLLYDGASATYIVLIKDVQVGDAGEYQCEVVLSTNNKLTAVSRLSVLQAPIISDNTTSAIVTTEGEAVEMSCHASGNPAPSIVWRRENNALLPTGE